MKVSYSWLQSLIKEELPTAKELADLLTMRSFETEYLGEDILEVDILPNRAHDCLGHRGIAREAAAILGLSLKKTDYAKKLKEKENIKKYLQVKIEDQDLCLRYTGRAVLNVQPSESPEWIKERLIACGLRPISNIVDITNYVMLETGQPLHAFDLDKVAQRNIVVRRAKVGEKITTLEKEKYDLDENVLLITDSEKPLCIAGIKGGQGPEIDEQTKNIILEAANFQSSSIRKTSQRLKLSTDASYRFERGLDPNLTEEAINMAAFLIQDIAGGQVAKGLTDVYPRKTKLTIIELEKERVDSLLGMEITAKEIKNILIKLGFKVQGTNKMKVTVPSWRLDVCLSEDLIEEVGRLYGYEKIANQFPLAALIPPVRNEEQVYQNKIRDILCGLGFDETYNYSWIGDSEISLYKNKPELVEIANPLSREQKYLRPNLILNLLGSAKENKKYFEKVKIFEIGRVFQSVISAKTGIQLESKAIDSRFRGNDKKSNSKEIIESQRIGAVISSLDGFYLLKGILDSLLNKLGISDQWYDDVLEDGMPDFCHPTKRAEVKVGDDSLGWLAEIGGMAAFELDFGKLAELATEEKTYLPPSKYPAMVRDIAVLVGKETKVAEILNLIESVSGDLVRDVDLFDVYEDGERKSIAFHIIYQSDERNLTDREVNEAHEKIINTLEKEGGWEVKK